MANSNKNKGGRPPKYNPKFHPQDFIEQSKQGKHLYQIAASWDIARETLWEWTKSHDEFSNAVKKGQEMAEAWYMQIGMDAMLGEQNINVGMFVWLTKIKFKWKESSDTELKISDIPHITLNYKLDEKKT